MAVIEGHINRLESLNSSSVLTRTQINHLRGLRAVLQMLLTVFPTKFGRDTQGRSGTCKNCVTFLSRNDGFWKKNLSQVCHKIPVIFIWLICFDPSHFKVTFHSLPRLLKNDQVCHKFPAFLKPWIGFGIYKL